ncbi:hypothetical protein KTD31_00260 [Burkholderia multivorans]|uniref:hypothetical protein n=1 Tax=Burkholderia multivorans TaxID=87883 RepID=UPI001C23EEA9|nr:hypothetical protein [Burkholderia multivorans]MBU9199831.1 hypothetical protein [Burkholderia multivorans]MDN8079050.1 hypothetical protein [Burkholderia multivorans]
MGEAKRKREQAKQLEARKEALTAAAASVSHAIRRLAEAASAHIGSDCYLHAGLGRVLLADLGFEFQIRVGFAAWRLGPGDGDVISHTPHTQGYLPAGALGFAYHAWLTAGDWLLDFTTYQLARKAQALDAADGGHTTVEWCPDYLLTSTHSIRNYRQVAQASKSGVFYYEASAALAQRMAETSTLDADDIETARVIMRNPEMRVMGPNSGV